MLYVCNVAEADAATGNEHTRAVEKMAEAQGARTVVISAAIEAEVAQLPDEEAKEFLARSAWRSRASTSSSAPATSCST